MKNRRNVAVLGALAALALLAPLSAARAGEDCCEKGAASTAKIRQLPVQQVRAISMGKQKGVIIDSRSAGQYRSGHIPGAISLPVSQMAAARLPKDKATPVVFYCGAQRCGLSTTAAQKAVKLGYKNVAVYKGGWLGWTQTASR